MIPRLTNRQPRARTPSPIGRANRGQPRLESLAAEFALLTQRRSRAVHELATLDQQRAAAVANFAKLQRRIVWIMDQMEAVSPDLRTPAPEPEPPPAYQPRLRRPSSALAAIGREWIAAKPQADAPAHPARTRRT